jgi:diaminohydroxyphosphoribosylaminopyrimidine deaminase/5-amino-6-(5-phosphoribosylamino)uracil reductase
METDRVAEEMNDGRWMRRAVALARRGWGRTSPNPLVGAVVVQDGNEVGAGWHARAGGPHAEVEALAAAGTAATGATLYVTLEPCSTQGRTPPCTDALIDAGLRRVVVGTHDPNPAHAGRGISLLQAAGLTVDVGVESNRCAVLNEAFFCWIRERRPYVLLKLALTADGRIATRAGDSQWITGPAARRHVQRLRQWADAVLVGAETVRRDNPQLLVRQPQRWRPQPLRLVASRSGDLGDAQLLHDGAAESRVINCPDAAAWQAQLQALGADGVTALLVEGGGELAAELLGAGLVDKVALFTAPMLMGGRDSRPAIGGRGPAFLHECPRLQSPAWRRVGDDMLLTGYLTDTHQPRATPDAW